MKWRDYFPSIYTIISGAFVGYIAFSIWNLVQLFQSPVCTNPAHCLKPYLVENPSYQLLAYTSSKSSARSQSDLDLIHHVEKFDLHSKNEYPVQLSIPKSVQRNGTLYLYLILTPSHLYYKDLSAITSNDHTVVQIAPITTYKIPDAQLFKLLGSQFEERSESEKLKAKRNIKPVTHLYSIVAFSILSENLLLPREKIPHEIWNKLKLDSRHRYQPILHIDLMNLRIKNLVEVSEKTESLNITLNYFPTSYGQMRLWMQFEASLDSMKDLGFTEKDLDEVKGIFSDSNFYLLCVTFVVSALHLLFDFLAFKNDISFWKNLDQMTGISPSTIAWRGFAQTVIFFYLLDEKTSLLVLVPAGIGAVIEYWKIFKTFHVWSRLFSKEETKLTNSETLTHDLDSQGFKYLSYLLYPLVILGAVYSLIYMPHKSWYSWLINSMVNGVYAFGFLFMLPQLFINYKLKSTAHLPWKAFMYKAFNTFIDDLFAFIITMPTAHRVACFRDDVVFVIYLYQRWLYPVDKTRVNEYGQTGEDKKKIE